MLYLNALKYKECRFYQGDLYWETIPKLFLNVPLPVACALPGQTIYIHFSLVWGLVQEEFSMHPLPTHVFTLLLSGITPFTPWTTRIFASSGTGANTTSLLHEANSSSITIPSCACQKSTRWKRSPGLRGVRRGMT